MRRKLATYSLAMAHRDGGPKAVLFERLLGITLADIDHLEAEIRRELRRQPITRMWDTPHGRRCQVLIPVRSVHLHQTHVIPVTTGWMLRYVGDRPRLVTAYIKGKRVR